LGSPQSFCDTSMATKLVAIFEFETCEWIKIRTNVLFFIRNVNFINKLLFLYHECVAIMYFQGNTLFWRPFGRHLDYLKHELNRISTYVLLLIRNVHFINNLLLLCHLYVAIMYFRWNTLFWRPFWTPSWLFKHVNETELAHMY
jgi:hypothetical protein